MKMNITREWLLAKLAELDAAGVEECADAGVPHQAMVCKLQLHVCEVAPSKSSDKDNQLTLPVARVRFGGVWEGSSENQAASENAIFGHWTPHAEFNATIMNQHVIDQLKPGQKYYVSFTEAPD